MIFTTETRRTRRKDFRGFYHRGTEITEKKRKSSVSLWYEISGSGFAFCMENWDE